MKAGLPADFIKKLSFLDKVNMANKTGSGFFISLNLWKNGQ